MICPTCSADTRVIESRRINSRQYRFRRCASGHEMITAEIVSQSMTVQGFRRLEQRNRKEKIA